MPLVPPRLLWHAVVMNDDRFVAYELAKTAALVDFDVLDEDFQDVPGEKSTVARITLRLGSEDEDDVEWGAFGFIFALAALSFADARPRGVSAEDFVEGDGFAVLDFFAGLRFERGRLHYSAGYVRGRCVKTDIEVHPDGLVVIDTRRRGEAARHWIERLKGKKRLEVV